MDKQRLVVSLLVVLGVGTLVTSGLVNFRSREPAAVVEPVVNTPVPQAPPLPWVKKSGPDTTEPLTAGDVWRQQPGTSATAPPQSTGWGALGQGGSTSSWRQDRPMTAEEQERFAASRQAAIDQSVQRMKQLAADAEARRVAEAQQAELLVRQAEAERIAAEQAAQTRPANARSLQEQALLGGDPTGLPFFETSGTRGPANLTVCNESSYRIKVGVVRTNRAYLGLWGSAWVADGFHSLSSGCRRFSFGMGKALASGYISIFQEDSGGRWHSLTYDEREPNRAMKASLGTHSRWICWPQTDTGVDPSVDCPDSNRNVLFGLGFGTSGHVAGFTITVTDDGLTQHVRQY